MTDSASPVGGPVVIEEDVEYLERSSGALRARLYVPDGDGPYPAVVNVHGGAWVSGDLLNNERMSRDLAAAGVAVMAIDFRVPPIACFPDPVADINRAVRWLKVNSKRVRSTPARVGGMGFSSGGHQLALNALRPDDVRWAGPEPVAGDDVRADLAFLILCYAVLDPVARYQMALASGAQNLIAGHHAYWPDEATMAAGSPQHIVERGEAVCLPRTLVIQGVVDNNLTPDMADRFGTALRAAGGDAEVTRYEDAPHGFLSRAPDGIAATTATERILGFIGETAFEDD